MPAPSQRQASTDPWQAAITAPTLVKAHEAIIRLRPPPNERDAQLWRTFYSRSAAVYRELAETDRGHHHEALYWAEREQQRADQLAQQSTVTPPLADL